MGLRLLVSHCFLGQLEKVPDPPDSDHGPAVYSSNVQTSTSTYQTVALNTFHLYICLLVLSTRIEGRKRNLLLWCSVSAKTSFTSRT